MASVMGICGGLVGPKSGNVEKVLVFKAFLKGSRRAGGRQRGLSRRVFGVVFGGKCFVLISRNVLPTKAGRRFLEKLGLRTVEK